MQKTRVQKSYATVPLRTVSQISGIVTRNSETTLQIPPQKQKKIRNFFGVFHRGLGTIDSRKKPDIKNLMLVSL